MSAFAMKNPFDFVKLKELDKKEDRYDEYVNALFEENGLYRKKLPKGTDSLMRAVSEGIYFTSANTQEIQQSLLKHLTQLIASNKLTTRLSNFQGNSMVLKDFANNPQLTGFEKTNLELVSLFFKVRVVLYTMSEDHYLSATIFNNNYTKTIEILRTKASHYDAVFPKSFIAKAGICQNIVLNLIDKAINGNKSSQFKNINGDEYVNITNTVAPAANPVSPNSKESSGLDQFRITRGHHKKSLSDNFNTNFEFMEEQEMKFYDAFMNAAPADDLLKNFRNRKDTAESNFSINANFDFIDEQTIDPPFQGKEFAIKNYPIPSGGLSPRAPAGLELDSPMPAFSKAKFSNHPNILFNENLSLAEIERLEKNVNTATTQDSKLPFYGAVSPPGLSPAKFSQRSFVEVQTPKSDFLSATPTNNFQPISPIYHYSSASPAKRNMSPFVQPFQSMTPEQSMFTPQANQRQYTNPQVQPFAPQSQQLSAQSQTFNLQPQQFNSMYMKRMNNIGTSVSTPSAANQGTEDFSMGQYDQGMGYEQNYDQSGMEYDSSMFGQGFDNQPREKKKPIILDESQERYMGRLKFFDENKKYGFIVMDGDGSDIFVHYDDLIKANITKDLLRTARMGNLIRLTFSCMAYIGKYNRSRKAIDIQLVM